PREEGEAERGGVSVAWMRGRAVDRGGGRGGRIGRGGGRRAAAGAAGVVVEPDGRAGGGGVRGGAGAGPGWRSARSRSWLPGRLSLYSFSFSPLRPIRRRCAPSGERER